MAFTLRSKRMGYDNIATGSATGIERHVVGGGPGDGTTREHNETLGVSADLVNSSFIANRPVELELGVQNVSDANLTGHVGSGPVDITPASNTTPGYTSTTSWTSAINELLG